MITHPAMRNFVSLSQTLDPEFDDDDRLDLVAMRHRICNGSALLRLHPDAWQTDYDPLSLLPLRYRAGYLEDQNWKHAKKAWEDYHRKVRELYEPPPSRYDITTIPYEPDVWKDWADYVCQDDEGRYVNWTEVPPEAQAEIDAYILKRYGQQ